MNKKNIYHWYWLIILITDFCIKRWIFIHFTLGESKTIMPCINFTYIQNSGAAFGFLNEENGWQCWFLSLIAIIISIILLYIICYSNNLTKLSYFAYIIIFGGTLSNLFDRIIYGFVIDFIDFYLCEFHLPIFNIADLMICIGTILILLDHFYYYRII